VTAATTGGNETLLLGDRYRLGEVVGTGGMADVHRATDEALHREVAVKLLRPISGGHDERARFISEARMLAGLSHTGLVMVLDAGFDAERPYLVMELVEGTTLAQLCGRGPCSLEQVELVAAQVAETLAFVHARGIVHRDVKPGNVLIGDRRTVKLADFGIARLVDQDVGLTRTGFVMGTVAYVSPEQVRGETVTGAADVYSLGLLLLEALTGRREYDGADLAAAQARLTRPPVIPASLPGSWAALLRDMTALDPVDRPSAAEVAVRVRSDPTGPIPVTRTLPPDAARAPLLQSGGPPSSPRRAGAPSTRYILIAVGLALLGLLVIAGVVAGTREPDGPGLPADTPTELRGPLADLHDAVHGDD
jgi:eukaryotic-like serine/threonine-protein kinase